MRVLIAVDLNTDEISLERLTERAQGAFDRAFPYARMETVKVLYVLPDTRPDPSSTVADG